MQKQKYKIFQNRHKIKLFFFKFVNFFVPKMRYANLF